MEKLRKGDEVEVLTGKDRTKRGTIMRVLSKENKVIVEGVNIAKKHMKAGRGMAAGIIEKAMPLHASNVMVICTECGKPTRIGHEHVASDADEKERVRRVCKQCGQLIQEHTRD